MECYGYILLIYDVIVNSDVRFERLGRWLIGENLVVFDFYLIGKNKWNKYE